MQPFSSRFTLMSLNLRFGLADDGINNWQARQKAYPELLASVPADFYLFQETNDFQAEFLDRLLHDHTCIGLRDPAPEHWQNNVIFYRRDWRCTDHRHFYLSATPDIPSKFSNSRWPRQCTMCTFERGGLRLTVFNTHFDFENDVQCRSAELIRREISALPSEQPVVLAGDFNAAIGSDAYKVLTTGPRRLINAFTPPYTGTFHGFSGEPSEDAIDWILYRWNMAVEHASVIQAPFADRYPSDHFPLTACFRWVDPAI